MPRLLTAIVGVIAAFAGCNSVPQLTPRLILQGEAVGGDFWLQAPFVAVITVNRVDLIGPRQATFRNGPKDLQLIKFDVNLENMIKGDLEESVLTFYFISKLGQPGLLLRGKRYIVSLRREGSVYRSWADGTQLNIEVHSGSHKQKDLPINSGPSITIAYILLTPGADANPAEFSSHLGWPPNQYGEPIYIYERLKKLQFHRSRIVRDSACVTAANIFWYRPRCLQDIAERPDSQSQAAAKQFLTDQLMLRERLRVNPFFLAPQPSTEYAFQTLEIFADDMRPDVRKQACTVLREVAPLRTVQSCK